MRNENGNQCGEEHKDFCSAFQLHLLATAALHSCAFILLNVRIFFGNFSPRPDYGDTSESLVVTENIVNYVKLFHHSPNVR